MPHVLTLARAVVGAAALMAAGLVQVAAAPAAPPVVVVACVSGGVLTDVAAAADHGPARTFGPRYRLTGRKALVKEIKKDHAGHLDEFTGTISGDQWSPDGQVVDLGKLSVRVGGTGSSGQPNAARVPETPVFEVLSFRHTGGECLRRK